MGNMIFLSAEVLLIGGGIYFGSFFKVCVMTIFCLVMLWFWFGKKEILYYVIPLIFLVRIFTAVNFQEIVPGKILKTETNIVNGRGRALKIDNKFPLRDVNLYIPNTPDGRYIVYGKYEKFFDKYRFYYVEPIKKEEIQPNRIEKFFNQKLNTMKKYLSNRCGNFLQGVILGERRYIYRDVREKFIYSGSAHLLAISGLHISAVIGIILYGVNFLKIKREIRYFLAFICLSMYVAGISISPSVVRAYIMGSIFLFGKIFYETADMKKSLALAAVITLVLYPVSVGNISFLMSYICLFAIIYVYPKYCFKKKTKSIKLKKFINFLIFTGTIQIFIIPVSIYFFGTAYFLSYFSNMFVTPVGMIYVTLGFVSFFFPEKIFAFIFSHILEKIYGLLHIMLDFFKKIPYLAIECENKLSLKFVIFIYIMLIGTAYRKEIKKFFRRTE